MQYISPLQQLIQDLVESYGVFTTAVALKYQRFTLEQTSDLIFQGKAKKRS